MEILNLKKQGSWLRQGKNRNHKPSYYLISIGRYEDDNLEELF